MAPSLAEHPLPRLVERGVPVTLNTDIPLFTGVPLVQEYRRCAEAWDLAPADVLALARRSVQRSFCPDHVRVAAIRDTEAMGASADSS